MFLLTQLLYIASKCQKQDQEDIISVIKETFEELKADLLSEIKELINLEVEKAMKKQKEEFKSAIDTLQERVTNLEHAHDGL